MVGSKKQGYAIASVMASLYAISVTFMMWFQLQHHGTVPTAVGAAMEGVEQRFGIANSAVFADSTTLTSTGAVDSFHDSYTSLGGMMAMFNMQLGEVAPGGTGSGLYGMLILAVITVFVAGTDGRAHPGIPRQEDQSARNQARRKLFSGHAADRLDRHRDRDGTAG